MFAVVQDRIALARQPLCNKNETRGPIMTVKTTSSHLRTDVALLAISGALACAVPAFAQTPPVSPSDKTSSNEDVSGGLEEIVVTARRREGIGLYRKCARGARDQRPVRYRCGDAEPSV
jgi:hypothetical protein